MDRIFAEVGQLSMKHQQTAYQQAAQSASKQLGKNITQKELSAAATQQAKKGFKQAAIATGVIGAAHVGLSALSGDENKSEEEISNTTPEENKALAQQFTSTIEQDPEFEKLKQELSQ
jgi:hypothetical protein